MHIALESATQGERVAAALREFGVERWTNDHVPAEQRSQIMTFMAPSQHGFEATPPGIQPEAPLGAPTTISTHGLRPGDMDDERFCVFAGQDVPRARIGAARPEQYAVTLARLLDIPTPELRAEALI